MAVTVEKMYQTLKDKYQLKIIAGKKGMYNMVQWISVIDNNDIIPYMRSTELAVTTGFAIKNEKELMQICIQLQERSVSGIIINIGPYIAEIPESIIEYCENKGFPLFSLPWEVRLIDIINETDQLMIYNSHMKDNIAEIFKDYIIWGELRSDRKSDMEKYGFSEKEKYQMILLENKSDIIKDTLEVPIENIRNDVERKISIHNERFVIIFHYNQLIILIAERKTSELKRMIADIHEMIFKKYAAYNIYIMVGHQDMNFQDIRRCYNEMIAALPLAKRTGRHIMFYDDLDIYKLLITISEGTILREYYEEILGNLIEYDKINHTDTISYLRQYVKLNGSIQEMARENFVHRNTITYNLKKIEKITGLSLENWNDRLKIQICLLIHDLL